MSIGYETSEFDKRDAALGYATKVSEAEAAAGWGCRDVLSLAEVYLDFLTAGQDEPGQDEPEPTEPVYASCDNSHAHFGTGAIFVQAEHNEPVYVNGVRVAN